MKDKKKPFSDGRRYTILCLERENVHTNLMGRISIPSTLYNDRGLRQRRINLMG